MTAHKHAAAMLLYAQDAAETDTPWERWERRQEGLEDFHPLRSNPHFDENVEYRRKPRTIRIGERDVPEPMRVAPAMGTEYFYIQPCYPALFGISNWYGDSVDSGRLAFRICHSTKEAAVAHAEALILISGGTL